MKHGIALRGGEPLEPRCVPAVAIVDSGFGGAIGYDFAGRDEDTASPIPHGRNVADAVLAVAPSAQLIDLKVVTDDGRTNFRWIEEALRWVSAHAEPLDIDVVNISIGASHYDAVPVGALLEEEFAALNDLGVIVVASAGNAYSGDQRLAYPAVSPQVLAVMALGNDADGLASYSQRSAAAMAAPPAQRGTSFAVPYVAGAVQRVRDALGEDALRSAVVDHIWATAGATRGGYRAIDLDRALESLPSPALPQSVQSGSSTPVSADLVSAPSPRPPLPTKPSSDAKPAPPPPTPVQAPPVIVSQALGVGTSTVGSSGALPGRVARRIARSARW